MKKIYLIVLVLIIVGAGFFYWYSTSSASVGSLNIYNGDVDIVRANKSVPGKNGNEIKSKDILKVHANSKASIILKDGSVIRLEAGSEIQIDKLEYQNKKIKNAVFELKSGKLWSDVQPLSQGAQYQIETPSVVAAVRGTSFDVEYNGSSSLVYSHNHQIQTNLRNNPNEIKPVSDGQIFKISDSNLLADFQTGPRPLQPGDINDWIKFNVSEDRKIENIPDLPDFGQMPTTTVPFFLGTSSPQTILSSYALDFVCVSSCSGTYKYTIDVTKQDSSSGVFFGQCKNLNDTSQPCDAQGVIYSPNVSLGLGYSQGESTGYWIYAGGTVAQDGSMSGQAYSSKSEQFNWTAKPVR